MDQEAFRLLAAGLAMGIGAIGPAIGEGMIASKATEGMARNPEVADKLFANSIVFMAICESTGIYSLVVALIILFAA